MMIVPGRTTWPSYRFTPRRFELLSRPFLLLLPAFLCAMSYSCAGPSASAAARRRRLGGAGAPPAPSRWRGRALGARQDLAPRQLRVVLPMAALAAIAGLRLELEVDDLLAT